MNDLQTLSERWLVLKDAEAEAQAERRQVEDKLLSLLGIAENYEGTVNSEVSGGIKIKTVHKITRSINSDKIQELAQNRDNIALLQRVFDFKPSLKKKEWDALSPEELRVLAPAVTEKPARASFFITQTEEVQDVRAN